MEENKQLRILSQNLAKFIGDGLGGLTAGLGFTGESLDKDFKDFVYRGDKETLHRLYEQFREQQASDLARGRAGDSVPNGSAKDRQNSSKAYSRQTSPALSRPQMPSNPPSHESDKKPTPDAPAVSQRQSPVQQMVQTQRQQQSPVQSQAFHQQQQPQAYEFQPSGPTYQPSFTAPANYNANSSTSYPQAASAKSLSAFPFANTASGSTNTSVNFSGFMPASEKQSPEFYNQQSYNQQSFEQANSTSKNKAGLFFDTAEPSSMPTAAFTNNFISEYWKTGLTPTLDTTDAFAAFQNFDWGNMPQNMPFEPVTPVSSTSASSSNPSTAYYGLQGKAKREAIEAHLKSVREGAEAKERFRLPSGITADEVISSSPLLSLIHLVSYHVRNKSADPDYQMPEALQPTQLQLTTPHDFRVDGILHAALRDALISKADTFDADEFYRDMMVHVTVHPTAADPLDFRRSEFSEYYHRKYQHLLPPDMVANTNSWRRSRGEPDITF